jgi:hypothetical protein
MPGLTILVLREAVLADLFGEAHIKIVRRIVFLYDFTRRSCMACFCRQGKNQQEIIRRISNLLSANYFKYLITKVRLTFDSASPQS